MSFLPRDRCTYICLSCRFTSKWGGKCPHCREFLLSLYDYKPPRKRDLKEWLVLARFLATKRSLQMCNEQCCIADKATTLKEYAAIISKRRAHWQAKSAQYY